MKEMRLLASRDEVVVKGQLISQRYRVTISPELKGERGYGLAAEFALGQRFIRKSHVLFSRLHRFFCVRGLLRFSFFQVNTRR